MTQERNEPWATLTMNNGDIVLNNVWGTDDLTADEWSQSITYNSDTNTAGWQASTPQVFDPSKVLTYPQVFHGHKDRDLNTHSPNLPIQCKDCQSVRIQLDWLAVNTRRNAQYNFAVEAFFHNDPNPDLSEENDTRVYELMIWLHRPASEDIRLGVYMTTVEMKTDASKMIEFDVFYKPNEPDYIAFIARETVRSIDLQWFDFVQMTNEISKREGSGPNAVPEESWLTAIEAGTELWAGVIDIQVSNFNVEVASKAVLEDQTKVTVEVNASAFHKIADLHSKQSEINAQLSRAYHDLASAQKVETTS